MTGIVSPWLHHYLCLSLDNNKTELMGVPAQAVSQRLFGLDIYKKAKRVGCYLSMSKGELQTNNIISDLLNRRGGFT